MKYLKTMLFEFIILIILTLINTVLYYFNITSTNVNSIFKVLIFVITFMLTGIYISRRSNKKNYIEGFKIAGINILLFLILALLIKYKFNLKLVLYYLLLTLTVVFGSITGKLFKKKK